MTQLGANRWARGNRCATEDRGDDPWSVRWTRSEQILTHYYTGVHLRDAATKNVLSPSYRWNPLRINWGATGITPPDMQPGQSYPISVQVQNTGVYDWVCNASIPSYALGYRWRLALREDGQTIIREQTSANRVDVCGLTKGAAREVSLTINDIPNWGPGTYSLRFDIYVPTTPYGSFKFSAGGWPEYSRNVSICPSTGCVRQTRKFDVAFVIDTTGSMWDDIAAVKSSATQIVTTIAGSGDDYRVAVVDYRDVPVSPYGGAGDYPSRVALDFSADQTAIVNAINGLTIGWGDDWPESVHSGLMAGVNLQWRADAEKVIIMMGDAPPHDPQPNTGYTSDSVIAAANAGGTPIQSGFATMAMADTTTATNGTPIHIHPILIGGDTDARATFQQLADGTGGTLFQAAAASDVTGAVLDAINTAVESPTADAGGPYSAAIGQPITFDGLDSFDPDGVIEFYEWDFDGDGVFDSLSTDATATYTYTAAFSGTVMLRVTDDAGNMATDTAAVQVGSVTVPTLVFAPGADARVEEEFPTTNYATSSRLEVDGGTDLDSESYLRFTVSGVSGTVQRALLRVYSTTNPSEDGPAVYTAADSWTEGGITWNNRPARTSGPLDDKGAIGTNTWVEYDVTAAVTANGTYTFVFATDDDDGVIFSSREGSNPAQLVVTPGTPPSSYTIPAVADTRVKQANPTSNYGTSSSLDADGSSGEIVQSYLRFTVSNLSGTIQRAQLRLYATGNTVNGPALYATSGSWTETGVTWNTRPAPTGSALDNKGTISTGTWVEYDVTALVTGNGTYKFALIADDDDGVTFSSREGSNPPRLVVTLVP